MSNTDAKDELAFLPRVKRRESNGKVKSREHLQLFRGIDRLLEGNELIYFSALVNLLWLQKDKEDRKKNKKNNLNAPFWIDASSRRFWQNMAFMTDRKEELILKKLKNKGLIKTRRAKRSGARRQVQIIGSKLTELFDKLDMEST